MTTLDPQMRRLLQQLDVAGGLRSVPEWEIDLALKSTALERAQLSGFISREDNDVSGIPSGYAITCKGRAALAGRAHVPVWRTVLDRIFNARTQPG